ncbi:MAG: autoinducer binding domain-containing protein [Pseudomonadota bacterium]
MIEYKKYLTLNQTRKLQIFIEKLIQILSIEQKNTHKGKFYQSSLFSFWQLLLTEMKKFGFDQIMYGFMLGRIYRGEIMKKSNFLSTFDSEFMDIYVKENHIHYSYPNCWCIKRNEALSWFDVKPDKLKTTLHQLFPDIVNFKQYILCDNFRRDFGLNIGVSIPLSLRTGNNRGGLGLCTTTMNSNEFRAMFKEYGQLIIKLVQAYHQHVNQTIFEVPELCYSASLTHRLVYLDRNEKKY